MSLIAAVCKCSPAYPLRRSTSNAAPLSCIGMLRRVDQTVVVWACEPPERKTPLLNGEIDSHIARPQAAAEFLSLSPVARICAQGY